MRQGRADGSGEERGGEGEGPCVFPRLARPRALQSASLVPPQERTTASTRRMPLSPRSRGEVSFREVTFGYNSAHPILKGVSFSVPGGKTLALVGPTGSGKSTVRGPLGWAGCDPSGCVYGWL